MKMRSLLLLLVLCSLVFLVSCGGGSTSPTGGQTPPALATQVIGAAGGELQHGGFRLTVPAGAFPEDIELTLHAGTEDFPDTEGSWATGQYRLEGVPTAIADTLQLDLVVQNPGEGEPLVLVGEFVFPRSLGEIDLAWNPFEAEVHGDTLSTLIPPTVSEGKMVVDYELVDLPLGGTFYYTTTETAHFRIYRPLGMTAPAADLGTYLEEAYDDFQGMGFSYAKRTRWPVRAIVMALKEGRYGEAVGSVWGYNYTSLRFSTANLSNATRMRRTAGHEFFHFVQDFYDPRGDYARATEGSRHYWLDEATAVWSEERFSDDPDYVSPIRNGLIMEPFEGVHAGVDENAAFHGYGMSAMIKWLVDRDDPSCVKTMYDHILAGEHPARAVELASGASYESWFTQFLRAYMSGSIYGNAEIPFMIAGNYGRWTINGPDDTEIEWTRYPHALGGLVFEIRLNYDLMADGKQAKISLTGDTPRSLEVFSYGTEENSVLLGSDPDSVVVDGLKALQDAGQKIVIMTTNPRDGAPLYFDAATHVVRVELRDASPVLEALQRGSRISYSARVNGGPHHFRRTDREGTTDFSNYNFPSMGGSMIPGDIFGGPWPALNFTGNSFSTELVYQGAVDLWEWEITGSFSADGTRLLELTAYGETGDDVYYDEQLIGRNLTTLMFRFSNLDLHEGYQLDSNSCYLPYLVQGGPPSITFHQSWPYLDVDQQVQTATVEYLGSDWSEYANYGFTFIQSAP
jgi:hypothetical protein